MVAVIALFIATTAVERPFTLWSLYFALACCLLGRTEPHILWISVIMGPEREADSSPPRSTEVKNTWVCTFIPPYVFLSWWLIKQKGEFNSVRLLPVLQQRGSGAVVSKKEL
jgi:hypothetical protein